MQHDGESDTTGARAKERITVTFPKSTAKVLQRLADADEVSVASLVRKAVTQYVKGLDSGTLFESKEH
jgi:hypothetical protein